MVVLTDPDATIHTHGGGGGSLDRGGGSLDRGGGSTEQGSVMSLASNGSFGSAPPPGTSLQTTVKKQQLLVFEGKKQRQGQDTCGTDSHGHPPFLRSFQVNMHPPHPLTLPYYFRI